MQDELRPPRECIVDLALLLENALENADDWCSGDQVMDVHHLKARLKEREEKLDQTLAKVRLQGAALRPHLTAAQGPPPGPGRPDRRVHEPAPGDGTS